MYIRYDENVNDLILVNEKLKIEWTRPKYMLIYHSEALTVVCLKSYGNKER